MKGVILAGGTASRLRPLTWVTNKHLLPVYEKPMIYYPLEAMARAGIKDIMITTSPGHAGHFMNLLRSGRDFGLKISYEIQEEAGGLSEAVALTEQFVGNDKFMVILGDNIFDHNLAKAVQDFEAQEKGAKVFFKKVEEASQYGVGVFDENGTLLKVEEKPEVPKSDLAQTGLYMYDSQAFGFVKSLERSARGELEITDLNNAYIDAGQMSYEIMEGDWIDAGSSHDELLKANIMVAKLVKEGKLPKLWEDAKNVRAVDPELVREMPV
ncbi:MAG: NTP transferase domain-containing protein [Candidatus Doudnabacteria bacterium]|nr:NTP transferase domain-containing protein [Candidatus Doudnabacteria bacterium]